MIFLILMVFGTLFIASAAVFFSVLGLVQTFSDTAIYWGTAIEIAKLILASFLYRFWDSTTRISKAVNIMLIVFLMTITSLGIYGHIITSYQEGNLQITNQNIKLEAAQDKLERIREKVETTNERIESNKSRIAEIDGEISRVPDTYVTARRELIQEREPEKNEIRNRIDKLFEIREVLFDEIAQQQDEISNLKIETGEIQNKVGPIMFVVETLGATGETAIFWLVLIIVLSFDPAAVALTVYTNKVALALKEKKYNPVEPTVLPTSIPSSSTKEEFPNKEVLKEFFTGVNNSVKENNERLKQMQETFDKDIKRKKLIDDAIK